MTKQFKIEKQKLLLEGFLKELGTDTDNWDRIESAPFELDNEEEYKRVLGFLDEIPPYKDWLEFYETNKKISSVLLREKYSRKITAPSGSVSYEEPTPVVKTKEVDSDLLVLEAEMISHNHPPHLIAKYLTSKYNFITMKDNEDLYVYKDGIYAKGAKVLIKEECKVLKNNITTHLMSETINHVKTSTYIERDQVNNNPFAIWLENGIYDWDCDIFMPFSPKQKSIFKFPIKYNKAADCPEIKKFLDEVISKSDIPVIQELFGYCLYHGYPIQKAFMFLGEGSNGKSTLINLFKAFLGPENISSIAIQDFENKPFYMAQLYGKLANLYPDIPDIALKYTGKFKMLTGGDTIFADKKFRDGFNFVNSAKLIFSANKLPETRDDTKAFFRRWIFINFPRIFDDLEKDPNKLEKITSPQEMSGLFNWSVEGLRRLMKNGKFSYSLSTEELQDKYERMSNSLSAFVKDCIEGETDYRVSKEEFYNNYITYCKNANLPIKTKKAVGMDLPLLINVRQIRAIPNSGGERTPCWVDICIRGQKAKKVGDLDVY